MTNSRACWTVDSPRALAMSRRPLFMYGTGLAPTNPARDVWAGVRLEPTCAPRALTSLNSAAYWALVTAGGPSVVN